MFFADGCEFWSGAALTAYRSKGLSCELLSIYCSLVIAAFVNPIGLETIGWKYYIVFCMWSDPCM